jgi:hypothetical protein
MLGCQHVRDGIATIKTEKTNTEVTMPISAELAEILSIGPKAAGNVRYSTLCGLNSDVA